MGGTGVEEDTRHGTTFVFWRERIDALANASRCITALQSQLVHESMGEGVQQDIAQARIACLWRFHATGITPLHVRFPEGTIMRTLSKAVDPGVDGILAEFYEDALSSHLTCWHPRR